MSRLEDLRAGGVQAIPHGAGRRGAEPLRPGRALALANKSRADRRPGTGKSTTLRALIDVLVRKRHRFCLLRDRARCKRPQRGDRPARTHHYGCLASPAEQGFIYTWKNPSTPI
jgi:hypothetical protein